MIKTVKYNRKEHEEIIHKWWQEHGWPTIPHQALPQFGLIALLNDKPRAVGFIYKTDSCIAWLEWILKDPSLVAQDKDIVLDYLIKDLIQYAKDQGFRIVFTSIENKSLGHRLLGHGFKSNDSKMTNMTLTL